MGVGAKRRSGGLQLVAAQAPKTPVANGMTIRGLAGPYVVMAQNFAPGTTAADIESAMMPVGGLVNKCRILKTHPITIAEVEFQTKEGADRVIESFNNQLVGPEGRLCVPLASRCNVKETNMGLQADGRVLHVYPKLGGTSPPSAPAARTQHQQSSGVVVDGSMGFEPMQVEGGGSGKGLYSDDLVGSANTQTYNRGGRGNRRGRGGNNR